MMMLKNKMQQQKKRFKCLTKHFSNIKKQLKRTYKDLINS